MHFQALSRKWDWSVRKSALPANPPPLSRVRRKSLRLCGRNAVAARVASSHKGSVP